MRRVVSASLWLSRGNLSVVAGDPGRALFIVLLTTTRQVWGHHGMPLVPKVGSMYDTHGNCWMTAASVRRWGGTQFSKARRQGRPMKALNDSAISAAFNVRLDEWIEHGVAHA